MCVDMRVNAYTHVHAHSRTDTYRAIALYTNTLFSFAVQNVSQFHEDKHWRSQVTFPCAILLHSMAKLRCRRHCFNGSTTTIECHARHMAQLQQLPVLGSATVSKSSSLIGSPASRYA
ncbi:hypothetical protein NP493_608g02028 [Ridgeia piscesae]|uniref:Uncharacterized protein n=1 Tax=Ridgeia piscesae TaxID=27915 RepID=A0AAD9KUS0_RIDPI|nr:hypothetical protein NP493_608g02028 [Ridgeia piscesae]